MGLLTKSKPTLEDLEDRKEYLTVESEVASKRAEVAEKEAVIRELRSRYGSGWRKTLGLGGRLNLQTLRSVLAGPQRGLQGMAGAFSNSHLSPLPGKNLRR